MGAHRVVLFIGTDTDFEEGLWEWQVGSIPTELTGITGATGIHQSGLFDQFNGDGPDFVQFNGLELFQGVGADGKFSLWTTNGTAAGTQELLPANAFVSGLFLGSVGGEPGFTVLNNRVLFAGLDAFGNRGVWSTDGTAAGTVEVKVGVQPRFFTNNGSVVLFNDVGAGGHESLFITDGTSAGTHEITPIGNTNPASGLTPQYLATYNGLVLFEGSDAAGNQGLWGSSGSAAGTFELTIAHANAAGIFASLGGVASSPDFTTYNGVALFQGEDDGGNIGLWMTDGTGGGTHEIAPSSIAGASSQFAPDSFIVYQGKVYFAAQNNTNDTGGGGNLWVTDGTAAGTTQIHVATEAASGFFSNGGFRSNPSFTIVDGILMFRGFDSSGRDGTWLFTGGLPIEISTVGTVSPDIHSPNLVTFRDPTSNDYFGDSTSDVALTGPGGLIDWDVQNGTFSRVSTIGNPGGYSVVHGIDPIHEALAGDFNGDGTSDILLSDGGNLVDWMMHNGTLMGGGFIGNPASFGYSVVGTGDFNGDGISDILIQDGSGNLADWLVKSGGGSSANVIGNPAPFGYHAVATGDFNGDGTTDVLLQNSSGTLAEWVMQNGVATSANVIGNPTPYGFSLIGTGDFNGDGTTDLLLGNSNGTIGDWMMQNGNAVSANVIGNPASFGYNVVGTGDYNGDGITDILIQNAAGNIADWTIKNGVGTGSGVIGNPVPYGFHLA
jgi:ELWxxDGT repeat protein